MDRRPGRDFICRRFRVVRIPDAKCQTQRSARDGHVLLRHRDEKWQSRSFLRSAPNANLRSLDFPAQRVHAVLAIQSLRHPTRLALHYAGPRPSRSAQLLRGLHGTGRKRYPARRCSDSDGARAVLPYRAHRKEMIIRGYPL